MTFLADNYTEYFLSLLALALASSVLLYIAKPWSLAFKVGFVVLFGFLGLSAGLLDERGLIAGFLSFILPTFVFILPFLYYVMKYEVDIDIDFDKIFSRLRRILGFIVSILKLRGEKKKKIEEEKEQFEEFKNNVLYLFQNSNTKEEYDFYCINYGIRIREEEIDDNGNVVVFTVDLGSDKEYSLSELGLGKEYVEMIHRIFKDCDINQSSSNGYFFDPNEIYKGYKAGKIQERYYEALQYLDISEDNLGVFTEDEAKKMKRHYKVTYHPDHGNMQYDTAKVDECIDFILLWHEFKRLKNI